MTDAVHSFHSPIFDAPKSKKLPASFYWGMLFALLLHLALLYYFFNQTFATLLVDNPPDPPATVVEFYKPTLQPPVDPAPAPKNVIVAHTQVIEAPVTVETVPIDPKVEPTRIDDGVKVPPVISPASGTSSSNASTGGYVKARWTRFPDSNALGQYYPARATSDEIEGTATVECTVLDASGRVRCTALSEVPGNYGFGKATVQMVQDKGRVDTSQGDVRIGSVLRTTVKWTLG